MLGLSGPAGAPDGRLARILTHHSQKVPFSGRGVEEAVVAERSFVAIDG